MTEVIIQGFLGRDAVVRSTEKGSKFLSFTLGSNDFFNGEQKTQWFDCVWFDYNEKMVEYLKKGSGLNVVGMLDCEVDITEDGKAYIRRRVNVHYLTFSSTITKKDEEGTSQEAETPKVTKAATKSTKTPPSDEEISVGNSTKKFSAEADMNSDLPF